MPLLDKQAEPRKPEGQQAVCMEVGSTGCGVRPGVRFKACSPLTWWSLARLATFLSPRLPSIKWGVTSAPWAALELSAVERMHSVT